MKLAIPSTLLLGERSGIGNYLYYLASELCHSSEFEEILFIANSYGKSGDIPAFNSTPVAKYIKYWVPQAFSNRLAYLLWHRLYLGRVLKENKTEVVHFPSLIGAQYPNCRTVLTVHDLSFVTFYPQTSHTAYYREYGLKSVKSADRIVTDSDAAKHDLIEIWKVPDKKISVIPLGCAPIFKRLNREQCLQSLRQQFSIDSPYILYVGNIEPRKNLIFLINVFEHVLKLHPGLKLIIAGRPGFPYPEFYSALQNSTARYSIMIINGPSTETIVQLYNSAVCLCYPSLMEGFGLPVLEAFNCGCPVISADNSSLPEVVGDSGILLNAKDVKSWVGAIVRIMEDNSFSDAYRAKGIARAATFSWEKCAKKTTEVYRSIL